MFTKQCSRCQCTKSISQFYSRKTNKDGLQSWCIDCEKSVHRTRWQNMDSQTKCTKLQKSKKYGKTWRKKNPEWHTWHSMIYRCTNPKSNAYRWYGARGIKVCNRWLNSFEAFLKDAGKKPSPKYSIDRINVDGNYEPGNIKWATRKEQTNNQRNNIKYRDNIKTVNTALSIFCTYLLQEIADLQKEQIQKEKEQATE